MKKFIERLRQLTLPTLRPIERQKPLKIRPQRISRVSAASNGPLLGMPIFDPATGAEIMSVRDHNANTIIIFVEDMNPDGHPQTLIPRFMERTDYNKLVRQQTRRGKPRRGIHS